MLRRTSFLAIALALSGVACSSNVTNPGSGGSAPTTTASTTANGGSGGTSDTGGTGGTGGVDPVDAGDGGDAPPDAPPGSCKSDADCPSTGIPCFGSLCVAGMCAAPTPAFDFTACDDGNTCTENDYCMAGACVGSPLSCPNAGACNVAICDPVQGCLSTPANNGDPCDDGDPCTGSGSCQAGICQKGTPLDCTFLDGLCTQGTCDPQQGCISTPKANGTSCNDNLFCTVNDSCQNGVCVGGGPNPCNQGNPCFVGVCNEAAKSCAAVPGNNGAACDDGSPCTMGTTCQNGICGGGVAVNNGAACDDGVSCTMNTTCQNGICGGGGGATIFFADDFHDGAKGWTLDTEWQIGPAKASTSQDIGNPDPALDHTTTADNGVAGVVIGGNAGTALHGYYYLTSPPMNTSVAAGQVILSFYRFLNSDFAPWMTNIIEVWNGTAWMQVWKSGNQAISDGQWTFISHDLTAHKNNAMRVRFGFNVGQAQAYDVSGWNIDDVRIASISCP